MVAKGAPQAILELAGNRAGNKKAGSMTSSPNSAPRGIVRSVWPGLTVRGDSWSYLGILPMFDPPRDDSRETIERAGAKGVAVKMVTGDDTAIARETARQLGLGTNIIPAADAFPKDMDPDHVPGSIADAIEKADGFCPCFFRSTNTPSSRPCRRGGIWSP